jgi:mono/diheme cytochrome c family protein
MTRRRVHGAMILALALALGAAVAVYRPEIPPIVRKDVPAADAALLRRGAELAALGDCTTCHTAPGGRAFAGGVAIPTPFGTIHSTNITPDEESGIGRWSEAAFRRAMREGVDREGRHLYPAFPYDHFTLVSDDDNLALYAYLTTRAAVYAPARPNDLPFPLTLRSLLGAWKFLFLHKGPFVPDPQRSAVLNRGAYLVEGIGHCGACHTPRNMFGAEKSGQTFAGGDVEGWRAFTINAASPSPVPWNEDSLYAYLRQGWHGLHGVARGPMAPVADNLAAISDADVRAIATYVAFQLGQPSPERRRQGDDLASRVAARADAPGARPQSAGSQTVTASMVGDEGAVIYASACTSCHDAGRPVPYGGLELSLSTAVSADTPRNLLNVVLGGVAPAEGRRGPIMPAFAATLSDAQITALTNEIRRRFGHKPPWVGLAQEIATARQTMTGGAAARAAAAGDDRPAK